MNTYISCNHTHICTLMRAVGLITRIEEPHVGLAVFSSHREVKRGLFYYMSPHYGSYLCFITNGRNKKYLWLRNTII